MTSLWRDRVRRGGYVLGIIASLSACYWSLNLSLFNAWLTAFPRDPLLNAYKTRFVAFGLVSLVFLGPAIVLGVALVRSIKRGKT